MQSVQTSFLSPQKKLNHFFSHYKGYIKWALLSVISLLNGYASVLLYSQGEFAFALLTIFITALGVYVFSSQKMYKHRYIYPGIAGMIIFVLFPLLYTFGLSFTNYSATNQLNFERVQRVLLDQTYLAGKPYPFELYNTENGLQLAVRDDDRQFISPYFTLETLPTLPLDLVESSAEIEGEKAPMRNIVQQRALLSQISLLKPSGEEIRMSSLRNFAAEQSIYTLLHDDRLFNNQTNEFYKPNFDVGFYELVDENGEFAGKRVAPGFVISVGADNYQRVLTDDGIREPFIAIFIWTVVFAFLAVTLTLAVGLVLACIVQWEPLKGSGIYRVLLILPYAVPSFISILIFKGLFNQSFGEINMVLEALFGIKPNWFSDPTTARVMVVIVNTWLGFPYMMILCMGLLKSIPDDLYEASAIDGAGPIHNFFKITLPMMIKPLAPLLIASFAFNFNNFVMIRLLTSGGPNMIDSSQPAGYTDLLVSYTYRIAFEGGAGQDFGLAGAIATLIFLMVGALALLNLRFTKLSQD